MSILAKFSMWINKAVACLMSFVMLAAYGALIPNGDGPIGEVHNIILFIGDGMGENHLNAYKHAVGKPLALEDVSLRGQSETDSLSGTTDSAAGATALACGVRTINGYVGVYFFDPLAAFAAPMNLTELAELKGMRTGLVTTDDTGGATPAAFSAHTYSRGNYADIAEQQLLSDIDLIWGKANGITTEAQARAADFEYVDTLDEMYALDGSARSFGQFSGDTMWTGEETAETPTLSQMTAKAIDLLDDDENGFFIMIEGAHIDKQSHGKNIDGALQALGEFDKAVGIALDYAKADGDTMVIVTADHETGSVALRDGEYVCTTGSHSSANVPLLVYGCDDFITNGEQIKNKVVARRLSLAMGFGTGDFPCYLK